MGITNHEPQIKQIPRHSRYSIHKSRLDLFWIPESRTLFRLNPGSRRTPSRPCANTTCLCVSKKWSDFFTNYYIKHLKPLLPKLALWALTETVIVDEETGITQNQSESITFVMHSLLKWKEVPTAILLLARNT